MEINEVTDGNVRILELNGRLDSANYVVLENKMQELVAAGVKNTLINCKNLDYISSSGLRIFLIYLKKYNSFDGKLYLCCLQEMVDEIFKISNFKSIFRIFDTKQEAIKELK